MKRFILASFGRWKAPGGSPGPDSSPAPAGSSVTLPGMFTTAQCQKPPTVGASGSNMVTAKLFVPDGKPLQESCGETSWPPAPKMPLTCAIASFSPSRRSLLVSENEAAGGRLSYGFQPIRLLLFFVVSVCGA